MTNKERDDLLGALAASVVEMTAAVTQLAQSTDALAYSTEAMLRFLTPADVQQRFGDEQVARLAAGEVGNPPATHAGNGLPASLAAEPAPRLTTEPVLLTADETGKIAADVFEAMRVGLADQGEGGDLGEIEIDDESSIEDPFEAMRAELAEDEEPPPEPDEADLWRRRLHMYRDNRIWAPGWGPRPGQEGCLVPAGMM